MDFLTGAYPWIKALHIISVIAWMASMLYLPRLFVYHAAAEIGSVQSETFKVMERRLARGIMLPAMILTLVFGGMLLSTPGIVDWHQGWIHGKLCLVFLMLVLQHFFGGWRRAFAEDRNRHTQRFFRMVNEVPTILMIGIVILVVVKPF
ncbi:MAG TPA: protoporphyrinogen oxidase HemJ [Aliidongia sp.]|uniref:protoporphyrinogen oxidase HemJ n=1 Tax=Aliidongia sp. TaxID=1914230 RepID=UPI002DDC9EFA|nr:protoporphyrinogen oxidase HemJ [Aliidongia sp.]HEV2676866.1 protoporphyrinogen oxidase HemJ [Aliidongia sp.]